MKHTLPQHMPPNMEDIQRVNQLKRSLHLSPLCFGMKIKTSGVEPEVKINISSILPFFPMLLNQREVRTSCIIRNEGSFVLVLYILFLLSATSPTGYISYWPHQSSDGLVVTSI